MTKKVLHCLHYNSTLSLAYFFLNAGVVRHHAAVKNTFNILYAIRLLQLWLLHPSLILYTSPLIPKLPKLPLLAFYKNSKLWGSALRYNLLYYPIF